MDRQKLSCGVVILAAGASSRMGKPKMLLPWGDTTILGHLVTQWKSVGATQIVVVLARGNKTLAQELERTGFPQQSQIHNPAPESGMFSSIQCAARWRGWQQGLTHWVIALGDQPHLHTNTLRHLITLANRCPDKICQLTRRGRPRHPVLVPKRAFAQIAETKVQTLKDFLLGQREHWPGDRSPGSAGIVANEPHPLMLEESDDSGLDLDIDTPADYETALHLWKTIRSGLTAVILLLLVLTASADTNSTARNGKAGTTQPPASNAMTELRGRVVCLPEEMHRLYQLDLPTGHQHIYGFRTDAGKYYTLLRTKFSEALFADERFRQKELIVKGQILSDTQIFAPATIRSVREGVICDIYYYCDVCDIQTVEPGPCECCQGPTQLVEKPLGDKTR